MTVSAIRIGAPATLDSLHLTQLPACARARPRRDPCATARLLAQFSMILRW